VRTGHDHLWSLAWQATKNITGAILAGRKTGLINPVNQPFSGF
jgi:hypothetical protein